MIIYDCSSGIPKEYLKDPLPLEIKKVSWEETAAKVTVVYQGNEDDEITAFYLPGNEVIHNGIQFKRVVLLRNDFESDWDYNCRQDLVINQVVTKEFTVEVKDKVRLLFLTFLDYQDEYKSVTQRASPGACILF